MINIEQWRETLKNFKPPEAPEGVTCFSCVHSSGGHSSPTGYSVRCVIGHKIGGCCKMVSKPCGFYEESKMVFR